MDRLRSIAPDLVSRLSTASQAQRQRVALAVARWVTTRVQSIPLEIIAGLDGAPASGLNEIVEHLDDECLSLQAKEEAGEWYVTEKQKYDPTLPGAEFLPIIG